MLSVSALAAALKLGRSGRAFTGDCPNCGYRGFSVTERHGRTLVKCHAGGCEQADVLDVLRREGLWGGPPQPGWQLPTPRGNGGHTANETAATARLWQRTKPAEGTVVETYLRERGITIPIPPTLRYLPAARHTGTGLVFDCMVAAVACVPDRRIIAMHRTFLNAGGRGKANVLNPKCSLGPVGDGAVRLAPAGPKLVVAEGIENALTVMQAVGLPTWAALSAGHRAADPAAPAVRRRGRDRRRPRPQRRRSEQG
jgi:hypothetical protein